MLLCHGSQAGASPAVHAAGTAVGSGLPSGPAAASQLASPGLAHIDPALLAAARQVAARTGSGDASAAGHRHLGGLTMLSSSSSSEAGSGSASAVAAALAMLLAHALAAALMFWWARRGAEALAAAGRLLARRLPVLPAISPVSAPAPRLARTRRAGSAERRPRLLLLRHAVARRGPPAPGASDRSGMRRGGSPRPDPAAPWAGWGAVPPSPVPSPRVPFRPVSPSSTASAAITCDHARRRPTAIPRAPVAPAPRASCP
ncbi:hypothetical protein [Candidatus Frankia alpina]|uniref:hypothetical protein n=1 Tax=Candidatus Frankia alpina TaxID=2699483 RepID=UPI001F398120|nr:hypothetical protein [Candidatus Frankia alpina]